MEFATKTQSFTKNVRVVLPVLLMLLSLPTLLMLLLLLMLLSLLLILRYLHTRLYGKKSGARRNRSIIHAGGV